MTTKVQIDYLISRSTVQIVDALPFSVIEFETTEEQAGFKLEIEQLM